MKKYLTVVILAISGFFLSSCGTPTSRVLPAQSVSLGAQNYIPLAEELASDLRKLMVGDAIILTYYDVQKKPVKIPFDVVIPASKNDIQLMMVVETPKGEHRSLNLVSLLAYKVWSGDVEFEHAYH